MTDRRYWELVDELADMFEAVESNPYPGEVRYIYNKIDRKVAAAEAAGVDPAYLYDDAQKEWERRKAYAAGHREFFRE